MASAATEEDSRPHILIVEDDEVQSGILAAGLMAAGYAVDAVVSGLDAVWKVQDNFYQVVLIDYQIPEIDGLATARLIREFSGPVARPVLIALTSTPEPLNAREIKTESAFDLVFRKSEDLAPLLGSIEHCIASAPDTVIRRAAVSALLDQAWTDYFSQPIRPGVQGDNIGPARILVVEDDNTQQQLLASVMRKRGYFVDTSSDGLGAIHKIRKECYDLVLVDYGLPEIDGLAIVKLTHNLMDQAMRPRLIALTATPWKLRECEVNADIMFDEIVEKSSDFDELTHTVDRLLRSAPNLMTRQAATCAGSLQI